MLSSFHHCCSLPAFIIYGFIFQVRELQPALVNVTGPPGPITVPMGEDVLLPCRFSPEHSTGDMEVIWFREQFSPFVHRYKDGQDQYGEQMLEYQGRTELLKDGLTKGSVDLKIFHVQLSDRGNYTCFVRHDSDYNEAVVELRVTASGSAPLITLERYQDGGIQVACRATGWYPQPQVLWQDTHGQHLPSLWESVTQDESGLFTAESNIILTRGTNKKLSCSVRGALHSQGQGSAFYISDPFFQNAHPWMTALGVIVVAAVTLLIVTVYLFKIKGKHEKKIAMQEAALRDRDTEIEKQAEELAWRRYAVPIEEVKVVLDPDTAHCDLVLSDDCKSVKREDTRQDIPDIPERFNPWRCVLGREGFTSGRYYWEVEAVDGGGWTVGVSRVDVKRKGEIEFKPEEGIWAVGQWAGHFQALTSPNRTLLPKIQTPKRIRVSLDYEEGRVAFFSVDEEIPIFTFSLASFEGIRVHPWVWLGPGTWLKMWPWTGDGFSCSGSHSCLPTAVRADRGPGQPHNQRCCQSSARSLGRREAKQQRSKCWRVHSSPLQAMWVLALVPLILPALLPAAGTTDPDQPCPSEMNKIKDLLEVNCTGKALSVVPQNLPADTGILLLSANHLTSLSTAAFQPLTQLQDLDLADSGLVALQTGPPLLTLKELILSRNALEALPTLQGLPALTHLAVAHNSLVTVAPQAFLTVPRLQDLDLRGNRLQTLPPEAFAGLRALKYLDLSDNLLEELPKELLQDLEKLETLWLSGNRLRTLPTKFFPEGHFFAYVFLTENPWHCDCDLRYLRAWIRENADSVYQPERGLEKTKVEVAPEKVLCNSPPEHWRKPIIRFKPDCGNVGDADEEETDEYDDEEETVEKATTTTFFSPHPSIPEEYTTMPRAVTWPPLATTRPSLSTPCSSTLAPSTSFSMLASTRAPRTTTPAPASHTVTPTRTPGTATVLTAAPTSTPYRSTTLVPTSSLPTTMSTRLPSNSSHPQTTLANSTTTTYATLKASTDVFSSNSTAIPSTAMVEASSIVKSSSPPLMSTTPVVSTTMLSTHAPTLPAPRNTTRFTQPPPSLPPAPLPLCPCSTPGLPVPLLCSRAAGEGSQWGQWVLRHCCLLHWVLYLASLVLLVLTVLALAGWLVWMCLVGQLYWQKPLQTQEVQYPLLRWRESTGSPVTHCSSFRNPLQHPTFCTIKEVELCPEISYCTIKDLGIRRSPPASSSFCTTKELWVHHGPLNTSFKSFPRKMMVTNLNSLRTPSAYSLDRGVKAIGDVRVKYAGNTL
ncbi:platelet glycoprotein Ib alpha chain [Phalacrocorax carbo]